MSAQLYAFYYQGPYQAGSVLTPGAVCVGMVFTPLPTGSTSVPWGVLGSDYTVTAVAPDPHGNPSALASYPGDQVTLSGGVGTVSASTLASAYRVR
jgi:hypothetical protein